MLSCPLSIYVPIPDHVNLVGVKPRSSGATRCSLPCLPDAGHLFPSISCHARSEGPRAFTRPRRFAIVHTVEGTGTRGRITGSLWGRLPRSRVAFDSNRRSRGFVWAWMFPVHDIATPYCKVCCRLHDYVEDRYAFRSGAMFVIWKLQPISQVG